MCYYQVNRSTTALFFKQFLYPYLNGQLQEEKFEDNKKQLEVANQRMTDNTMVKTIMGGANTGGQYRQHNGQENKGGEGGDKQWWTRQTTQWSRE